MDIVYPLKKSAWDKEILFSLRSLDQYFVDPCKVHICGDYLPSWATNIDYHHMVPDPKKHKDAKIAIALEWACRNLDTFIWICDDLYFLKETSVSDLLPHPHIGVLNQVRVRGQSVWQKRLWATFDMLQEKGFSTIYNYETHLPRLYNSEKMLTCAKELPVFDGDVLHATVYGHFYPEDTNAKVTEKIGLYRKNLPFNLDDPNKCFLNHDDYGLSKELKQAIERKFNKKSKYER